MEISNFKTCLELKGRGNWGISDFQRYSAQTIVGSSMQAALSFTCPHRSTTEKAMIKMPIFGHSGW